MIFFKSEGQGQGYFYFFVLIFKGLSEIDVGFFFSDQKYIEYIKNKTILWTP